MPSDPESSWDSASLVSEPASLAGPAKAKAPTRLLARLSDQSNTTVPITSTTNAGSISININLNDPNFLPASAKAATVSKAPAPTLANYRPYQVQAAVNSSAPGATTTASASAATSSSPFPPAASTAGKRYYVFNRLSPPLIAAGQDVALALLDGKWTSAGPAPKGFASLEEALNHLAAVTGRNQASIVWD